ncbi:hypothetical protein E2C01_089729 [Portunus trituberculatus]|uniref:Uncharacterized protein n=1 Tax=Portunus trituberculatus TaxID=210409 RepID=A0A5B7JJ17_PORTR|nr:hypothetical protein [Portunus trituberculatus]
MAHRFPRGFTVRTRSLSPVDALFAKICVVCSRQRAPSRTGTDR